MYGIAGTDSQAGFEIQLMEEACEHFAVVDQKIVWYGNMNFLSKEDMEDNFMRVIRNHRMVLPENWMRQCSLSEGMKNGGCWTSGGCPFSTDRNGVEKDYMALQMNYQEKYEQGVEQEKRQSALRMIEAGNCPVFLCRF